MVAHVHHVHNCNSTCTSQASPTSSFVNDNNNSCVVLLTTTIITASIQTFFNLPPHQRIKKPVTKATKIVNGYTYDCVCTYDEAWYIE